MTVDTARPARDNRRLADVRLKRNEGRYLVARVDGQIVRVTGGDGAENAAFYRHNCLDIAEELADASNILYLLQQRLERDGGVGTVERQYAAWRFLGALWEAEKRLAELEATLPDDYLRDQYPVERDEVTQ
jgi:hypothetical protein